MMIATLAAASVLLAVANQAHAGATLDAVQKKGFVQCGISDGLPGFFFMPMLTVSFSGIDVDVCRGVAAAVFGDDTKVKYTPLTAKERFTALQSGRWICSPVIRLDFISRCRDGMAFTGVTYYDGIGFLTHDKAGLKARKNWMALPSVFRRDYTELNVADYFKANNMKYTPVTFDRSQTNQRRLWNLAAAILWPRINHNCMPAHQIKQPSWNGLFLPEVISKEPLGPVVRRR